MVKLKNLKLIKNYRYQVSVDEKDLNLINNLKIYNVVKKDNRIIFECQKETIKKLLKSEVEYEYVDHLRNYFTKNKTKINISIIFITIILIIYTLNQFLIRNISFEKNDYYNQEIYEYVINNTNKIGPFYTLNNSINEISKNMRQEFYEYAYVGLSKKGAKLLIEVVIQDVPSQENEELNQIGEYLAKEDATILEINLLSGQMVVSHNDVVKKGDLIATSNLQYKENLYSMEKMVPLVGSIIGKTISYTNIEVLKEEEIEIYTNRIYKYYTIESKNKILFNKDNPFEKSYIQQKSIFNLGNISLNKNILYEKELTKITRNKEEAKKLSEIIILQNFENRRTSASEKIVSLKLIKTDELEDKFVFSYLVYAYQNIVEFRNFMKHFD